MESSQKKGGVVLSYIMLISNVIVKFIYTPFLLKNIGQEEYGLYSLVITIVGYLTLLDLGFGSAIVRFTIKYRNDENKHKLHEIYGMMSLIYLIIGIIALLISFSIYANVDNLFEKSMTEVEMSKMKIMILLSGFNLLFSFPLQIASSVLIAYEKFIFRNGANLIKILIVPLFMVLCIILFDFKSVGLILIVTSFNLITYLSYYIYAYKKLDFRLSFIKIDRILLKSIIGFSSSVFLLMIHEQVQLHSGQFILGIFKGTKDVAVWGIAMIFVLNYRSISTAITNVFTPSIVSKVFDDDQTYINQSIFKFVRIQTYVLLITLLNFVLFGLDFLILWAGEEYKAAYEVSLIIMIPMTFALLLDFAYIIQIAKNSFRFRIITLFSSFFLSFTLLLLIFEITLKSYSIMISFSIIIGQIILMIYYIIKYIKFDLIKVLKNISQISFFPLLYSLIYYIVFISRDIFSSIESNVFKLIFTVAIFNCGLIIIYWFLCFSKEEKQMLFKLKRL